MKTIIEKCRGKEFLDKTFEILGLVYENLYEIIQDSYGNYALKKILESSVYFIDLGSEFRNC